MSNPETGKSGGQIQNNWKAKMENQSNTRQGRTAREYPLANIGKINNRQIVAHKRRIAIILHAVRDCAVFYRMRGIRAGDRRYSSLEKQLVTLHGDLPKIVDSAYLFNQEQKLGDAGDYDAPSRSSETPPKAETVERAAQRGNVDFVALALMCAAIGCVLVAGAFVIDLAIDLASFALAAVAPAALAKAGKRAPLPMYRPIEGWHVNKGYCPSQPSIAAKYSLYRVSVGKANHGILFRAWNDVAARKIGAKIACWGSPDNARDEMISFYVERKESRDDYGGWWGVSEDYAWVSPAAQLFRASRAPHGFIGIAVAALLSVAAGVIGFIVAGFGIDSVAALLAVAPLAAATKPDEVIDFITNAAKEAGFEVELVYDCGCCYGGRNNRESAAWEISAIKRGDRFHNLFNMLIRRDYDDIEIRTYKISKYGHLSPVLARWNFRHVKLEHKNASRVAGLLGITETEALKRGHSKNIKTLQECGNR